MEAQLEYLHFVYSFFARFGVDMFAHLVSINKISASELSRKSIKSVRCLVGFPRWSWRKMKKKVKVAVVESRDQCVMRSREGF